MSPSINAGISGGEVATERMNRLPPKHAVVVSGTSSEGRGVFFKLKRSSQTSLEGVHELSVTFVAPANWQGGEVHVGCSADGRRKVLWMKQAATVGQSAGAVRLQVREPRRFTTSPSRSPRSRLSRGVPPTARRTRGVVDRPSRKSDESRNPVETE